LWVTLIIIAAAIVNITTINDITTSNDNLLRINLHVILLIHHED